MQKNIVPTRKKPCQYSLSTRLKENEKNTKKNTTKQNKKTMEMNKKQ